MSTLTIHEQSYETWLLMKNTIHIACIMLEPRIDVSSDRHCPEGLNINLMYIARNILNLKTIQPTLMLPT